LDAATAFYSNDAMVLVIFLKQSILRGSILKLPFETAFVYDKVH